MHIVAPIYYDYPRTQASLDRMLMGIQLLEVYLQRSGSKYIAGNTVTIADFPLICATMVLYVIGFELTRYPLIQKWYDTFKFEHSKLYKLAFDEMHEIGDGYKNPPKITMKSHPIHPLRKN